LNYINYIPIATTLFSAYFFSVLYKHWKIRKEALHIFWWMIGVFCYGAGTITESINTVFGFSVPGFRTWYIFGALLGGAPLAQGTVYLFLSRKKANRLSLILIVVIITAAMLVLLSPVHPELVVDNRLTGKILEWKFVRYITPFINLYAFIFLVGGAIYSASKYAKNKLYKDRFYGNVLIAFGGLLPGIGGSFTKFGYVEVLYVTEFIGIIMIYSGYFIIRRDKQASLHNNQQASSFHLNLR
jgi:hypothetical protein